MTDAPGTCHLVGCSGKGHHPPHGIGAPDPADWDKTYGQQQESIQWFVSVLVEDVELIIDALDTARYPTLDVVDDVLLRLRRSLAVERNQVGAAP